MAQPTADPGRVYRGLSSEERRQQRRQRLVASAIELYGSRGYRATPILDVCSHAQVTPRHFYELFAKSEDLLLAAYDQVIAEHFEAVTAALEAAPAELGARVRCGVGAATQLWRDERRARLIQQEILGVDDRLEHRRLQVLGAFADMVSGEARRFDRTLEGELELQVTGHMLAGGLNEALMAWRLQDEADRPPLKQVAESISQVFLAALGTRVETR